MANKIERSVSRFPVLLALGGILFLAGCSSSVRRVDPPDEFKKAVRRLFDLEDQQAQGQEEIKKINASLPAKEQSLVPLKAQADQLAAQLQTLEKADELAYEKFAHLTVEHDSIALQKAAHGFIRDYPTSHLIADAKKLAVMADVMVAKQQEDKKLHDQQAEANELARKKALDDRFAKRELSVPELKSYLLNKSQNEIVVLFGQPTASNAAVWAYEGELVTDVTGKKRGINIYFSGGRVTSVGPR